MDANMRLDRADGTDSNLGLTSSESSPSEAPCGLVTPPSTPACATDPLMAETEPGLDPIGLPSKTLLSHPEDATKSFPHQLEAMASAATVEVDMKDDSCDCEDEEDDDEIEYIPPDGPSPVDRMHALSAQANKFFKLEKPLPRFAYKLKYIPGQGYGVIATRRMRRGKEIIRETPFITTPDPVCLEDVTTAFDKLDDPNRLLFLSFPATNASLKNPFERVMDTNAIPCGDDLCGMFPWISRVNHSCVPNTVWVWEEGTQQLVLLALRDIPRGDQLVALYFEEDDSLMGHADRQRALSKFGFTCHCAACSKHPDEVTNSDKNLAKLRIALRGWDSERVRFKDPEADRKSINEAIRLIKTELRHNLLDTAYQQLFFLEAMWGNLDAAKDAAQLLCTALEAKLGLFQAAKMPAAQWREDPTCYPRWNSLPPSHQSSKRARTSKGTCT